MDNSGVIQTSYPRLSSSRRILLSDIWCKPIIVVLVSTEAYKHRSITGVQSKKCIWHRIMFTRGLMKNAIKVHIHKIKLDHWKLSVILHYFKPQIKVLSLIATLKWGLKASFLNIYLNQSKSPHKSKVATLSINLGTPIYRFVFVCV